MESEEGIHMKMSGWKFLIVGFLFGVLASFLVLVVIACKWGPRGENSEVDMYSERVMIHKKFLWKRTHTPGPLVPCIQWAIDHQNPVRSWYLVAGGTGRAEWFGELLSYDAVTQPYVYAIYTLPIPEEEKVKLLHEYHQDLDALKLKEQERIESWDIMKPFYEKWDQKMKALKDDPAIQ